MDLSRRSGVLLPLSALPGPLGRGDLGPAAHSFVDRLAEAGQRVWQQLPWGPPGYGGSPYAGASAFAGDPGAVSPELLVEDGLLATSELRAFPEGRVSLEASVWRRDLLQRAWRRFEADADAQARGALARFEQVEAHWLGDYALFAAAKCAAGGGAYWSAWEAPLARRDPAALIAAATDLAAATRLEVFGQFLFQRQWERLRAHAHARGVELLGDVPIFVARDSADVWSRPELFALDDHGAPLSVAGVPPDAFSDEGQLWGNPVYDPAEHARTGYAWWTARLRRALALFDVVRLDHFRGFAAWYEVPAGADSARDGLWVPGLGAPLFSALAVALGVDTPAELPLVAEDLGTITPDVEELLTVTGFPRMKVLQFAFDDDDAAHPYLPENYDEPCVVYTGTHDNDTTRGWFDALDEPTRQRVRARIGEGDPVWGLVELAATSPAFLSVFPAQDVLGLGSEARFNTPGLAEGNWSWRLLPGQWSEKAGARLRALTAANGR